MKIKNIIILDFLTVSVQTTSLSRLKSQLATGMFIRWQISQMKRVDLETGNRISVAEDGAAKRIDVTIMCTTLYTT